MRSLVITVCVILCACSAKKSKVSLDIIPVKQGDYWGYVDREGKFVINPQFKQAFAFQDGLALVKSGQDLFGYIDAKGKMVIPAVYKEATAFSEEMAAVVKENQQIEFINTSGKTAFTLASDIDYASNFHDGLAKIESQNKYGYVNTTGKIVIPCQFEIASDFSEGLARISSKVKDKWVYGFIDKTGKIEINQQFDNAFDFSEGRAMIETGGKYGFIDKTGKIVITPQFDDCFPFKEGVASVKQGELFGFINTEGKFVINPQFKMAYNFGENGLAAIKSTTNDKWGFINKEGKMLIEAQFADVSPFVDDVAITALGEKYGLIDKDGKYRINPQYDEIISYAGWRSAVESDFFDGGSLTGLIFKDHSATVFKGLNKNSGFSAIQKLFPDITYENYGNFKPVTSVEENKYLELSALGFSFSDAFATGKPKYKNELRFNYSTYNYENVAVYDGMNYTYNDLAPLRAFGLYYHLKGKARDKKDKLLEMINTKIPAGFTKEVKEKYILANNGNYWIKFTVEDNTLQIIMSFSKDFFQSDNTTNYQTADTTVTTTATEDTTVSYAR